MGNRVQRGGEGKERMYVRGRKSRMGERVIKG